MRPAAPHFDLFDAPEPTALAASPAADSLVPVSGVTEGELPPDPMAPAADDGAGSWDPFDRPTSPDRPSAKQAILDHDAEALAFFDRAEEAVARAAEEAHRVAALEAETVSAPLPVSREALRRRAVFRRVVSAVVAAAAIMSMGAALHLTTTHAEKTAAASESRTTAAATEQVTAAPAAPVAVPPPAAEAEAVAPENETSAIRVEPVEETPKPSATEVAALTKKSLAKLEAGKYALAIEHAEAAIAGDPSDANPYLYWGTALMMTGKQAAAKAVFASCVQSATRGPKHECKQFR